MTCIYVFLHGHFCPLRVTFLIDAQGLTEDPPIICASFILQYPLPFKTLGSDFYCNYL